MGSGASHDITALLVAWSKGDEAALESLIPRVDQELHRISRCNFFHHLGLNTRHRAGSACAWSGNEPRRLVLPVCLQFDTLERAAGYLPPEGAGCDSPVSEGRTSSPGASAFPAPDG